MSNIKFMSSIINQFSGYIKLVQLIRKSIPSKVLYSYKSFRNLSIYYDYKRISGKKRLISIIKLARKLTLTSNKTGAVERYVIKSFIKKKKKTLSLS